MSGTRNLDELRTQALHCIEDAYIKGYEAARQDIIATGNKSEYERGLKDAEKAVKRVINEPSRGGLYSNEMQEIFGTKSMNAILWNHSLSEIIEKIREYDEKKAERNASPDNELHIGDEVYTLDKNDRRIVTALDKNIALVLCASGKYGVFEISKLHKTGRRFAIDEVLRELKE